MFLRPGKFWFLRTHELQLLAKTYGQCINSAPTSHNARQKHETCRDRYLVTFVLDWALHPLQTNLWHARLTWHGRWPVHKPWFKSDTLKVQLRKRLIISIVSWQGKQNVPKEKPRQCASSSNAWVLPDSTKETVCACSCLLTSKLEQPSAFGATDSWGKEEEETRKSTCVSCSWHYRTHKSDSNDM